MKKYTANGTLFTTLLCVLISGCIRDDRSGCPTPADPFLTLSEYTVQVYDGALTRVFITSNQESVTVDGEGLLDASGDTPFTVNDFFDNLGGEGAVNLIYDPETGTGYFDIGSLSDEVGTYVHRITVTAGEIQRTVTITTHITMLPDWKTYPYVGTFHRWNQTGERVISSSYTGPWSATVVTDEGGDFVVLNRMPSPATVADRLRTSDPGDAENYQVPGNETTVSGNGRIFFRVGLKGSAPSATSHRYTRIRVDWKYNGVTDTVSYVYVRQGEEADYLMRPENALTGSSNNPPRNLAVKYTPYNITDPLKGGGPNIVEHSAIAGRQGVFTDYPSKAGYLFLWNLSTDANYRRAINPAIPAPTIAIGSWAPGLPIPSIPPSWDPSNDVCPDGYRHVSDDPTFAFTVPLSEIRQSLFLNPKDGLGVVTDDTSNSLVGLYADGWFDRQETGVSPGASVQIVTVGQGADVAYRGRLYYNPYNNASLFFPFGGSRASNNGALGSDGMAALYWTTTSRNSGDAQGVFMQVAYGRINFQYKNNACFARCVQEPQR